MFVYNSLEIPVEKPWVLRILEEYRAFLISYHKEQKAVFHHLRNAANIFIAMEDISPKELTHTCKSGYSILVISFKDNIVIMPALIYEIFL